MQVYTKHSSVKGTEDFCKIKVNGRKGAFHVDSFTWPYNQSLLYNKGDIKLDYNLSGE